MYFAYLLSIATGFCYNAETLFFTLMLGAELKQETGHTKKKKHYFEIDCVGANIK